MNRSSAIKIAGKLIAPIFYSLLIIFIIVYIQRLDWSKLNNVSISWFYIAIATILGIFFRYWAAFIWVTILKSLGANNLRPHLHHLFYVYGKSWLGRYIPGTAPWILGKIYFASRLGVSKNKLAVSSLLEGGLQIIITLVIAILVLVLDARAYDLAPSYLRGVTMLVLAASVVALAPRVFNATISIIYKFLKKKAFPIEHKVSMKTVIQGSRLYVIGAIVSGASFFFIAKAVYEPLSYSDFFFVFGVSNLATAASMLAIFAPSGIGVRESIQSALLAVIMPLEIAILIAIVARVWAIACDGLFFIGTWVGAKINDR